MASKPKTWKGLWPAALVVTLLVLLTIGWFWAKGQAEKAFAEQAAMSESKTALTCGKTAWSGYPFKLQLDCADPIVHFDRGQTQMRPQKLTGYILAPDLKTIVIEFIGPTVLQNTDQTIATTFQHEPSTIKIRAQSTSSFSSDAKISGLEIQQSQITLATIDELELQTTHNQDSEPNHAVMLTLQKLHMQELKTGPISISEMKADLHVRNAPRKPVDNAVEWMKLAAVRATTFDVKELQARYGEAQLNAQGALKILETGTVDGSLNTRVTNLNAFLDDLQERQVLTPKIAQTASTLLRLFDNGEGVAADLRFQNEEMYWGPVKLGRQTPLF